MAAGEDEGTPFVLSGGIAARSLGSGLCQSKGNPLSEHEDVSDGPRRVTGKQRVLGLEAWGWKPSG